MKRLENKISVITGGAKGIGFATCEKFVKEGSSVIILDMDKESMDKTVVDLNLIANLVEGYQVDITDREKVEEVFKIIKEKYGKIDILINNAGIISDNQLNKMNYEQFDKVVDINLKGTFNCAKAVIPYMIEQQNGIIINATSIVGVYGNYGQTNYAATKWGVIGMMKSWAKEFGKLNIRSNAVAPGFIDTQILDPIPDKVIDNLIQGIPMKRLGKPEEIANVYAFLASDEASYINGAVIEVSGGKTL
ncbi:MAG: 3-oxoacyl-ACP reductase FabG [Bacillota bacterium]|nr:3-oxoacyl-ACP reductase FabG [Bacillota bacterium]